MMGSLTAEFINCPKTVAVNVGGQVTTPQTTTLTEFLLNCLCLDTQQRKCFGKKRHGLQQFARGREQQTSPMNIGTRTSPAWVRI
jgi:hypothetical protein